MLRLIRSGISKSGACCRDRTDISELQGRRSTWATCAYGGKVWFRSTPRRSRFTGGVTEPLSFPSRGSPGRIRTAIAHVLSVPSLPIGLRGQKLAERAELESDRRSDISLSRRMLRLAASRSLADGGGVEPHALRHPRFSRPVYVPTRGTIRRRMHAASLVNIVTSN